MGTFILLILIFFVIIPLLRGIVAVYRARRAARKFFDQFRNPAAGSQSAPEQPRPKAKKINPEYGEFVAFEELPADGTPDNTGHTRDVRPEPQVVDVEWEDIKDN